MEMWKPIPGYDGYYEASNFGRIRTASGRVIISRYGTPYRRKQKILKTSYQKRKNSEFKDEKITLHVDGEIKTFLVSRLIAMTWCDGYSAGMTVNHKDGNPLNNRYTNLEWVTQRENIRHAFNNSLIKTAIRVMITDQDGNSISFSSMKSASLYLGKEQQYVSMMLRLGKTMTPDGYIITRLEGVM